MSILFGVDAEGSCNKCGNHIDNMKTWSDCNYCRIIATDIKQTKDRDE